MAVLRSCAAFAKPSHQPVQDRILPVASFADPAHATRVESARCLDAGPPLDNVDVADVLVAADGEEAIVAEDTVVVAQPALLALLLELADRSDLAVLRGRPATFRSGSRVEPNWSWSLPSPNTGGAFVLTVWDVSGSITIALAENIQELTNCLVLAVFPGDVSNVAC